MKYHIDAVSGRSTNPGTEAAPKKYLIDVPPLTGNEPSLRNGQIHTIDRYYFLASGMTLSTYGDGPPAVIKRVSGKDAYVYIRDGDDITISGVVLDANGLPGPALAIATPTGGHIRRFRLQNVTCRGSKDHCGLYISGTAGGTVREGEITDSAFDDNGFHGTQCANDVQLVTYRRCIARRNGFARGAHGFSAYTEKATVPAPWHITWERCIAEDTRDVSPLHIEGQGFQGDNNSRFVSAIECIARRNAGSGFVLNYSDDGLMARPLAYDNGRSPFMVFGSRRSRWIDLRSDAGEDVLCRDGGEAMVVSSAVRRVAA